ncbi:MAG: Ig domain-containing protein [Terriglobales bacterium]
MKKLIGVLNCAFLLCLLISCGGGTSRPPFQPVTIISQAPPDGTLGTNYAGTQGFSFAARGGTPPYAWSWTAAAGSSLPPGLSLSAGTGAVAGTPATIGAYLVTVSVEDSSAPASQASMTYPIAVIEPLTPLAITSPQLPIAALGADYGGVTGYSLTASGGIAPYRWDWVATAGSSLPPGLTLTPNTGVISGIPPTIGSYSFTITVTDSESPPAQFSANFAIYVVRAGELLITTGPLPGGLVGLPYGGHHFIDSWQFFGFPLGAAAGTPPYNWSWAAALGSSLPPGLGVGSILLGGCSLACVRVDTVGGTPTAAGTYDVVVTVTDSATPPAQGSANYRIVINP